MAKQGLYAVYDRASGIYDGPLRGAADGLVVRQFCDMCIGTETDISKHPEDFTLFKLGMFNDGTGEFETQPPEKLINGAEAIAQSRQVNGADLKEADMEISANA